MSDLDTMSDEDLMARIQNGDHQAFATLVRRRTSMFYACAYRQCADQDEAEDAVQDAFLKLWHKPEIWNTGRGAKFTTWFYRVVVNVTVDRMRKRKFSASEHTLETLHDDTDLADVQLEKADQAAFLETAIQTLPEKQKSALNLCFYEGLSNKEAAEILGIGVKALESLLMRAKAKLRDSLTREGVLKEGKHYA